MPPQLALIVCVPFVVWLFATDRKRHGRVSGALWIPLLWFLILGSKTPATWLGDLTGVARDTEGSSLDTAIFLALLVAGFRVLVRRRVNWHSVIANNKWLLIYFLYVGVSVLWSDLPFSSLKLWIKDTGNIVMVLIVLSEQHPADAVKSLLLRSGYILVTLSVLLVKYFPDLSRAYDKWSYQPIIVGASTDKNSLGAIILICALGLFWSFFDPQKRLFRNRANALAHLPLMAMALWILSKSNCATALACAFVGAGILLGMRTPRIRASTQRLGLAVFIVVPLLTLCLHLVFNLDEALVGTLGRDSTLTGRTSIWEASLRAEVNPLIGAGYCSFWRGERAKTISEGLGFFYALKEAHNGYIETYLNSGLLGLCILLAVLVTSAANILKQLANGDSFQMLRFAFLVVTLVYNVTESAFNGLHPIWFMLLLVLFEYPCRRKAAVDKQDELASESVGELGRDFVASPSPAAPA